MSAPDDFELVGIPGGMEQPSSSTHSPATAGGDELETWQRVLDELERAGRHV